LQPLQLMLIRTILACCAIAAGSCAPVIDTTIQDAALTAAVTTALLNSQAVDGTLVSVRSQNSVVHLDGTQPSPEAVNRVLEIVRGVEGVRDVESSIEVEVDANGEDAENYDHSSTRTRSRETPKD
jgi:BON domain-containing protein